MIELDFEIDEDELLDSLESNLEELEDCIFVSTIFLMPMKMQINNLELFEIESIGWLPGPIISLASEGLTIVKRLRVTRKELYGIIEGPGDFIFTMKNNEEVRIEFSGFSGKFDTIVMYDELLEAFLKFADKVRKFLWERAPQINNHLYWGPWLRGERD